MAFPASLCLVLHAHLPFVRHPEHDDFLEERWLFEAITDSYLPLLEVFERLVDDGVAFRVAMSLSPPLLSMLEDSLLQTRYLRHVERSLELAEQELQRTRFVPELHRVAAMYRDRFAAARDRFENRYGRRLSAGFQALADAGVLELLTTGATHGYLPLLRNHAGAVRAQIQVAVDFHASIFGRPPAGIWLPECGFYPGLDETLADFNLHYFFVDAHAFLGADTRTRWGLYAPLVTPAGVAAFARDPESSRQVWSATEGYPGDFDYREYYRDIGRDLDLDYVRPFVQPDGARLNTGLKYYRITGPTAAKQPYVPARAQAKADLHAEHFLACRVEQVKSLDLWMGRPPVIVAPYDAELFGHWWFEGPCWLDRLIRRMDARRTAGAAPALELRTPSEYIDACPEQQTAMPGESSWGNGGYHQVWMNESNHWIYPLLEDAARRMHALAAAPAGPPGPRRDLRRRQLNQAARELLLAQSSDWAFIMSSGTSVDYAVRRTRAHLERFAALAGDVEQGVIDERRLAGLEALDPIFPEIEYEVFA